VPAYLYTVTAVRRSWAAAHEDAVVRYVRALGAAFRLIRDPQRRGAVVQAIVELTGVPPAIAEGVLALYADSGRKVLPEHGEIDLEGLAQVIAFMGEAGQLKAPLPEPERFVELRYQRLASHPQQ
jgi:ABC-type nitrate/sulfonate/bicarbonate transport system substrate-binding protein